MKRVLVWGLGASGLAALQLLKSKGIEAIGGDDKHKTDWRLLLEEVDTLVLSPGIPPSHPIWQEAVRKGIEVIGELELAWRFFEGTAIAITGTDGKSTTTRLSYLILRSYFSHVEEGGNIGVPFSYLVMKNPKALAVLEVSSFQGKTLKTFRPHVGAFLNFSEDHLDWHPDLRDYLWSKYNIFSRQTPEDWILLNGTQKVTRDTPSPARKVFFGDGCEAHVKEDGAYWSEEKLFSVEDIKLIGKHNLYNALVACVIGRIMGVPTDRMKEVLRDFRGLPHRLELVGDFGGVLVYNDSKSTTPNALQAALGSMPDGRVILIAGGKDKGASFEHLCPLVTQKVKHAVLIGEAKRRIADAWKGCTQVSLASSLDEAIRMAQREAKPGDILLFSPACSSFDMFSNYEERGETFKKLVREIFETPPHSI
ncbi:UDP-N-acetylmuramoylalanine/D-glutamate ligase [Thermocrinis albus DSM 14484]|uniref:UDP-N-acetylmuramoylalanine--D-glutamate ligase n=1 Tax=Thermocrinis albus (strain DSM 14484 / JCM 11386 / HI 11/12) TaxID=638303 RepID=D3SMC3_THEAH|nr:UDP-N-acetylmuramoyl-L-alanine--D-glutamate ligase [Thermocrinis albus]ADC89903.1 UDP-N-acetylmuramoylalanine/D-glutamate ligase [Thermocrinis albus DSM 14484]